jgi:hypothetical protein
VDIFIGFWQNDSSKFIRNIKEDKTTGANVKPTIKSAANAKT